MAKNGGNSFAEGCACCVMLVFIGAVVFVGCKMDDAPEPDWAKPEAATTESVESDWRLPADGLQDGDGWMWANESEKFYLLKDVSAEDVGSGTAAFDDLDDKDGLTAADVEVKLLSKPKHGTAKLNRNEATVTYTPWSGFSGTDKFRYSLKLKGKPEVVAASYSITVDAYPASGGGEGFMYDNCADARAAGAAPVYRGEPGYGPHLDADNDGIGCDWG
ncbi:excalibur calcium-binding domain-containing protein [Streptomyces flaveolus]|uniref:excalibur calcium-binding domain-containing protein n=1 Tax=Streptomyces flaveolus TaxID=67297 RepID=UPI0033E3D3FC